MKKSEILNSLNELKDHFRLLLQTDDDMIDKKQAEKDLKAIEYCIEHLH